MEVFSLESYLAKCGVGSPPSEAGMHSPMGNNSKASNARHLRRLAESLEAYSKRRLEAIAEYEELVSRGLVRAPNRQERLLELASGNPDLESTKAAKRLLDKRGCNQR